ncbi:MAG TPA: YCF48-related protein [Candidatus Sulfotelmatobacter sp.]|nr:YCF48-related protein [Candidatus Sulfotelmatobacter sp.]
MQNIPKIAHERLKVVGVAADHPDANLLTAFAEQTLREAERATVVEHLARCAECRYVVALALPAMESPAMLVAPGKTWFSWPVLRWGFAVAGIVVIATFGVVHYRGRNSSTMTEKSAVAAALEASNGSPSAVSAPQMALDQNKKGAPSAPTSGKAADEGRSSSRSRAAEFVTGPSLASGAIGPGSLSPGPGQATQENQSQQQNANAFTRGNLTAPAAPPPMAKQQPSSRLVADAPILSESEMPGMQPSSAPANTQSQDLQLAESQNQDLRVEGAVAQPSTYGHGEEKVGRAKEPTDTTVVHIEPEKTLAATARQANRPLKYSESNARWAITSAGGLQRSLDHGNSWQDVNVKASPAPSAATTFDVLASVSKAKARDTAKTDKDKSEPIVFRVVTANGSEVWAGGSAGQLYHSIDGGNHWSKVVPSAQGSLLTGDVVSLDFSDTQHGRVSTSTSEVWITGDDGLTWQKQ